MIVIKVYYCVSIELKYGTSRPISSSLFTQILKQLFFSSSSDFTVIWVLNKYDFSIYNHFSTFLYKLHDSQKWYFQILDLIYQINIYLCYIFQLSFFSLRNQLSNSFEVPRFICKWINTIILYHSFKKYSLRILTTCFNIFIWLSNLFENLNCMPQ